VVARESLLPDFAQRAHAVKRLMAEARSIASLQSPHVVGVYDIDCDADGPYIAMEFIPGPRGQPQTLEQKVAAEGPLAEAAAVALMLKVCAAVAQAHSRGIIH